MRHCSCSSVQVEVTPFLLEVLHLLRLFFGLFVKVTLAASSLGGLLLCQSAFPLLQGHLPLHHRSNSLVELLVDLPGRAATC